MRKLTVCLTLVLLATGTWVQEALFDVNNLTSPEVHADGTVTFRLHAPKAVTVSAVGNFGTVDMKEGRDGVWLPHAVCPAPV